MNTTTPRGTGASLPIPRAVPARSCRLLLLAAVVSLASGCAAVVPIVASNGVTVLGLSSMLMTGKGLAEHTLDMMLDRDCRIIDGILDDDRDICEERGSLATADDWQGIFENKPRATTVASNEPPLPAHALTLQLSTTTGMSAGEPYQAGAHHSRSPRRLLEMQLSLRNRDGATTETSIADNFESNAL